VTKVIELNNGQLASTSLDKTINIWDRNTGEIANTLEGFDDLIIDIQEINEGMIGVLTEDENSLLVWNHEKELEDNLFSLEEHDGLITKFCIVKKQVFTGGQDSLIKKWIPDKSRTCEITLNGHAGGITELIMIDHKTIASGSKDKTIRIWEAKTGWCQATLTGHTRPITKLVYIPEGQRIVSGSLDETIRVWSKDDKACLQVLEHGSKVKEFIFLG